jgi:hypothetical protein
MDFSRFHQIVEKSKHATEAEFAALADEAVAEYQRVLAEEVARLQKQIDRNERKLKRFT